jgi:hypothetical protein
MPATLTEPVKVKETKRSRNNGGKSKKHRHACEDFKVGELVEFWSIHRGGCWKPGVVVPVDTAFIVAVNDDIKRAGPINLVRIHVGNGICIIRHRNIVRHRVNVLTEDSSLPPTNNGVKDYEPGSRQCSKSPWHNRQSTRCCARRPPECELG